MLNSSRSTNYTEKAGGVKGEQQKVSSLFLCNLSFLQCGKSNVRKPHSKTRRGKTLWMLILI
jgi:hypothetical protein